MMGNNVIRAEGKPKYAMYAMMLPAVGNIGMDYLLINVLGMGMEGAAWATFISYGICFSFICLFLFVFVKQMFSYQIRNSAFECFNFERTILYRIIL